MIEYYGNGEILIFYNFPINNQNASTILEHVNSFGKYSQFKVCIVNTEIGMPQYVINNQYKIIIFHYSLFGNSRFKLDKIYLDFIRNQKNSYKIAFFQDEHQNCLQRYSFINKYKINCIYSCLNPKYYKNVYYKYTDVNIVNYTIPGFVDDNLVNISKEKKDQLIRKIDIGYRSRRLSLLYGKGAQEKEYIALEFKKRLKNTDLIYDIEIDERKRFYGKEWYEFLGNLKYCLGVEAGVSVFDIQGEMKFQWDSLVINNREIRENELYNDVIKQYENNISYRTISPRHFEAAAFNVCQILFEGEYSGIMTPMVHYIPLKKDFSNFEDVLTYINDKELRENITKNAYTDLIISGKYSYKRFIEEFDQFLISQGITPKIKNKITSDRIDINYLELRKKHKMNLLSYNHLVNNKKNSMYLEDKFSSFKEKPMLLVSGGPSILKQLDILKIYQEKLVITCMLDTAIKLLIKGIIPDFIFLGRAQLATYDISDVQLFNKYFSKYNIPLVHLSSADENIVSLYKGDTYVIPDDEIFVDNQHIFNAYSSQSLLKLLYNLQGNPIAMIGQELSFQNIWDIPSSHYLEVKANKPNESVYTTNEFFEQICWFQDFLEDKKETESYFFNCSYNGAYLEGWHHCNLEYFLKSIC